MGEGKFCPKCGTSAAEDAGADENGTLKLDKTKEQAAAGAAVPPAANLSQAVPMPAPAGFKKKKRKNKFVPALVGLCLLALLGGGGYSVYRYYTSPMKKFAVQLEQGNLDTAIMYLDQIGDVARQQEAVDVLVNSAHETYNNFLAEAMEYSEASRMISKISSALDGNGEVADVAKELDALNESRIAYGSAVKLQDSAKYADAIAEYEKVIAADTYYDTAQQAILDCMDLCREDALGQAAVYEGNGMYAEAIAALDAAIVILPNDTSLISERKLCESILMEEEGSAALEKAKALIGDGSSVSAYRDAREVLKAYLAQNPSDVSAARKRDEYDRKYYEGSVTGAVSLITDGDYEGGIALLRNLAKEYPDRKDLEDMIAKYESYKPVDLQTFDIYEKDESRGKFEIQQTAKDTWDNTWDNCITVRNMWGNSSSAYNSTGYLVVSKYNHFHCVLAYEQTGNTKGEGYAAVYMDDELLYRSESINRGTQPITVDVDLPDGQIFTIKFVSTKNEYIDLIMAEPSLSVVEN